MIPPRRTHRAHDRADRCQHQIPLLWGLDFLRQKHRHHRTRGVLHAALGNVRTGERAAMHLRDAARATAEGFAGLSYSAHTWRRANARSTSRLPVIQTRLVTRNAPTFPWVASSQRVSLPQADLRGVIGGSHFPGLLRRSSGSPEADSGTVVPRVDEHDRRGGFAVGRPSEDAPVCREA